MKLKVPHQRRNGKLAQKLGRTRRRIADKVYFPIAGYQSRLRDQWRVALKERGALEREAYYAARTQSDETVDMIRHHGTQRFEEDAALHYFKHLPTIWAILERNNDHYRRPLWADKVFGAN
jgi:hypothetical protein